MLGKKKNKVNSLFCPDKADTKVCRKKTNVYVKKNNSLAVKQTAEKCCGENNFFNCKKMLLTFV